MKQLKDFAKIDKIAKAGIQTEKYIIRDGGKILKPIDGYVEEKSVDPEAYKFVPYEFVDEEEEKRNPRPIPVIDPMKEKYPGFEQLPYDMPTMVK